MVTPLGDWDGEDIDHYDRAIRALGRERFDAAAQRYVLAAYATLSGHEGFGRHAFQDDDPGWVGEPLAYLALAGVCERITGRDGRAANRTAQGALIAQDQRAYVLDHPVRVASCHELEGDLHTIGGREEKAQESYDRALEVYRSHEPDEDEPTPARWTTEHPLQAGTDLVAQLTRPGRVTWDDLHGSDPDRALVNRATFRRNRMRSVVADRVESGKLHAPRGSTEFNTGRYECPACGSDDINFVADTVLCVRCSTPTEHL
jgi:hypothetical protein